MRTYYASGPHTAALTGLPLRPDYHETKSVIASCAAPPCQPGETAVDGPRDADAAKLARFVIAVADAQYSSPPKPALHWFKGNNGADGWAPRDLGEPAYIRLADRLNGRELVYVALHEHRHCAHRGLIDDSAAKEADADHYADVYTDAVLAAYRAADGSAWKVRHESSPPSYRPGACNVAIVHRPGSDYATCWDHISRRSGNAWQRIS